MKVVRKTREESRGVSYTTPKTKVVLFQPEGVICSSGLTESFIENDYSDGSFWN